ncbi:unnamed protein product [Rotaria magnacalcarata]|uniref:protein-tyrosine-phosphatase n=1 Tax=Rotaria magnacalcarata TaxID=392030 RepID=A0A816Z6Z6_9BILA|nr:unnamed protein product [Rotaria magnacalcarata]CAF2198220.1 unnamed protein product [Rotaria magnacalcarata]
MSTIINDFLYLGSINDACTPSILNQLKITHLINLSLTRIVLEESFELLHLPLYDRFDESIITYFKQANQFIEKCRQNENGRCLVFCKHGRSRSVAIVIGYLIEHHGHTVPSAYLLLSNIRPTISPNRNYINQLIKYSSQTELTRCPFISS